MSEIPSGVVEVRGEICARCLAPCVHQKAVTFQAQPCSACPINEWGQYGQCEAFSAPTRGLGDLVATIAQPIARTIDRLAGTNLANCGGCKERQAALNRILPKV